MEPDRTTRPRPVGGLPRSDTRCFNGSGFIGGAPRAQTSAPWNATAGSNCIGVARPCHSHDREDRTASAAYQYPLEASVKIGLRVVLVLSLVAVSTSACSSAGKKQPPA